MTDEKGVVEAALFSAGHPVSVEEIAQATGTPAERVRELVRAIGSDYEARGSAIEIAAVGGKWTMQIRMEYTDRAQAFAPPEIPRDLLKTAALIAYHQPILQSDLGDMIGSKVYEHVQALVGMNLVNKRPSGRSFEITTTRAFVEFFGLKGAGREEIRRVLSERAGVKFAPKPLPAETTDGTPAPEDASAPGTPAPAAEEAAASGGTITGG